VFCMNLHKELITKNLLIKRVTTTFINPFLHARYFHLFSRKFQPISVIKMQINPFFLTTFKKFFHLFTAVWISTTEIWKNELPCGLSSVFTNAKIDENKFIERRAEHNVFRFDVSVQEWKQMNFLEICLEKKFIILCKLFNIVILTIFYKKKHIVFWHKYIEIKLFTQSRSDH